MTLTAIRLDFQFFTRLLTLMLLAMLFIAFSGCAGQAPSGPPKAATVENGAQNVNINVRHGYEPNNITAKAGMPLKLNFYREEGAECGKDLVIPEQNIKLSLPAMTMRSVDIPPQKPGTVLAFKCGMGMLHGQVTFN